MDRNLEMIDIDKALDTLGETRKNILKSFGYVEGWTVLPIDDCRDQWWYLEGDNYVIHGDKTIKEDMENGSYYHTVVYGSCHIGTPICRTDTHTLIAVDLESDNNHFLAIFANNKEITDDDTIDYILDHD